MSEGEFRTIYPCSCGGYEYLDLHVWEEEGNHIFFCTVVNPPKRFIDRLGVLWGILTGRDYYIHSEVVLEERQAISLWQDLRDRVGGVEVFAITTNSMGETTREKLKTND